MKSFKEFLAEEYDNKIEKNQELNYDTLRNIYAFIENSNDDDVDALGYFLYSEYVEPEDGFNVEDYVFTRDDVKSLIIDLCDYFGNDAKNFLKNLYSILNAAQIEPDENNDEYEIDIDDDLTHYDYNDAGEIDLNSGNDFYISQIGEANARVFKKTNYNKRRSARMSDNALTQVELHTNKQKRKAQAMRDGSFKKRHRNYIANRVAKLRYGKSYHTARAKGLHFAKRRRGAKYK